MKRKTLGSLGQDVAEKFLVARGYDVVASNTTIGHCEIDLIAEKDGVLHAIEVKTRRNWAGQKLSFGARAEREGLGRPAAEISFGEEIERVRPAQLQRVARALATWCARRDNVAGRPRAGKNFSRPKFASGEFSRPSFARAKFARAKKYSARQVDLLNITLNSDYSVTQIEHLTDIDYE